jgi:F-type H+-transporting ATPase subunit delta
MNKAEDSKLEHIADVSEQRVAQVYAEALLNAAEKRQQADAVYQELQSLVNEVFSRSPLVEAFLSSSAISRHHKAEVINQTFTPRAGELLCNFLLVLNEHERLGLLRPILAAYRQMRDERARRLRVQVASAAPLPDDQRERLQQELRETFHLEPILETRVDPDLLGGLLVQVGDWVYDASVRTQLETIRNQLIARSSHEIQSRRDRFSTAIGD